jgi:hypothetical protein
MKLSDGVLQISKIKAPEPRLKKHAQTNKKEEKKKKRPKSKKKRKRTVSVGSLGVLIEFREGGVVDSLGGGLATLGGLVDVLA